MRPTSTKKAPLAPPPQLPLVEDTGPARTRWFGDGAAVVWEGRLRRVWVGGMKVADFDEDDHARRNVELVTLAQNPRVSLGELAAALGVSPETSRKLRRQAEREGTSSVSR